MKRIFFSAGFSLLEVLMALMIITSALLKIVSWQSLALRQTNAVYYQSLAAAEAQAFMERLRANVSPLGWANELTLANQSIQNLLPSGRGNYQCSEVPPACTVSIEWQDHGAQTLALSSLL